MMKKATIFMLTISLGLSGCLTISGDDVNTGNQEDETINNHPEEGHGDETEPLPPTATLHANITNGTAPLNVTFDLDGGVDDNETLAWDLDLGDGNQTKGTALPATVNHTYFGATNITAILAVSDGSTNAIAQVNITVHSLEQSRLPDFYLVGDGSATTFISPEDAVAFINEEDTSTFNLSSQGHGSDETTYMNSGPWNTEAWMSPFVPTFLGTEGVKLSGQPVTLVTYVASTGPFNEIEDELCPLTASLFDSEGNLIIAEAVSSFPKFSPAAVAGPVELNFTFEPGPGEYAGLGIQFGTTFAHCGTPPAQWVWGSGDHPSRVVFADEDEILE